MNTFALALICLACTNNGRRVQSVPEKSFEEDWNSLRSLQLASRDSRDANPMLSLAMLLRETIPDAGWQVTGSGPGHNFAPQRGNRVAVKTLGLQARPTQRQLNVPKMQYTIDNVEISGPMNPIGNKVLTKPIGVKGKRKSGLVVSTGEGENQEALMVAVGTGQVNKQTGKRIPLPFKKSQRVLMKANFTNDLSCRNVAYNSEIHYFTDPSCVLGAFEGLEFTAETFIPCGDNVLVETKRALLEKQSGIVVATYDAPNQGKVLKVGPGAYSKSGEIIPTTVKVNDTVIFKPGAGEEIVLQDKKFQIVSEKDCLGKW